ncbi:DMP19 family protein [Muricauda sp. CAU 1633]|uniref:DMP19 family protein n=1 Tax=Allomuricauda sp. CAU 1633 TaxID=2816036 RepID=UPI001A8E9F23|nr:DMP19 family protein [Muricauda sp. CAU 1633]MBO0322925.1 DMP19 family protein [Muricauda sp. CAU 1633]
MKLTIFIAIIIFLRYLVPRLVDFGAPERTERKSEWDYRVKFAKLNKEKFEKANQEEKEELLYYYTHKIRKAHNYSNASFRNMPKPLQVVWLINELETEVNNGGFSQFFFNSSGRYTEETLEALEAIGAKHNYQLLLNAVQTVTKSNERIKTGEINKLIESSDLYNHEKLEEKMYELDEKFYEYKEDFSTLKMNYIEKYKNDLWKELEEKYGSE